MKRRPSTMTVEEFNQRTIESRDNYTIAAFHAALAACRQLRPGTTISIPHSDGRRINVEFVTVRKKKNRGPKETQTERVIVRGMRQDTRARHLEIEIDPSDVTALSETRFQ